LEGDFRGSGYRGRQRIRDDRLDHRPGAPAQRWGAQEGGDQAVGLSRGGRSTKIHVTVDAFGNPTALHLTAGQASHLEGADT